MLAITSSHRSRLAFDGGVLCQPPPPPVVRVSRSMGVCCPSHHLHPLFASRVRWGCALPATTSSRLAFDGGVLRQPPPPPVVHISRSMGCTVSAITSCCARLAIDGGVLSQPPPPPVVRVSRAITSTLCSPRGERRVCSWVSSHSRLAFGEVVPCQPAPPPVVCVSRSMGPCPTSASNQGVATTPHLT